jgi:hypothetical protein
MRMNKQASCEHVPFKMVSWWIIMWATAGCHFNDKCNKNQDNSVKLSNLCCDHIRKPSVVGIHTASSLYILEVLCHIKMNEGNLKQDLSIHGHNMRSQPKFHVEFCIIFLLKKSVVNMGIKLYNKLSDSIQKIG